MRGMVLAGLLAAGLGGCAAVVGQRDALPVATAAGTNPIVRDKFTADPAPLAHDGRLYLYVGHDEAGEGEMFNITEWLVYSTDDMAVWVDHGPVMKPTDFAWASRDAWASEVIEKDGRFWFYTTVEHDESDHGKAIGVAVSDTPTGPFVDARGSALVKNSDTPDGPHWWDDIDPTAFEDEDGTVWLYWGNANLYYAPLAPDMISLADVIRVQPMPFFVEGPWLFRRGEIYYLAYAGIDEAEHEWEQIYYATAPSVTGPWTFRGKIMGIAENSFTIHPGIVEYKGDWYLFYHNAAHSIGGVDGALGRRSVRAEHLYFNADGTIRPVVATAEGVRLARE
ncbi:MAG TPA: glycoside hydrolase family 43 protein [Hyphomonas sp.]|nr:glycoside hydrolase family 43 protein [Hyphomonas sp.]HRK68592.1 glycoside hydrolase family 43 protein [Hyphomonas sp.]